MTVGSIPLHRSTPAAVVPREHRRGVHWAEPVIVGEVNFRNWTSDGRMRHPSWRVFGPTATTASIDRPRQDTDQRASAGAPAIEVAGAIQTADGAWGVEVVNADSTPWYRIHHAANVIDWLAQE